MEISFGEQNSQSNDKLIKLPEIVQVNNKINYSQIRALADSKSLKLRFSNFKTLKIYEPEGNISKKNCTKSLKKLGAKKLGSDRFKGVKNNIERYYKERTTSFRS